MTLSVLVKRLEGRWLMSLPRGERDMKLVILDGGVNWMSGEGEDCSRLIS